MTRERNLIAMKKILTLFMILLFAFSVCIGAAAYNDVKSDTPHKSAINLLDSLGIMQGVDEKNFEPDEKITRAQAAKIFFVMITTFEDCANAASGFVDTVGNPYDSYISWCRQEGIVGGVSETEFNPDGNITLDQMLKMSVTALGYGGFSPAAWPSDVRFLAVKQLNLTDGIADSTGEREITRGEAAQIICNLLFAPVNKQNPITSYSDLFNVTGTVAYDIWGIEKYRAKISATQNYMLDGSSLTASSVNVYISNAKNTRTFAVDPTFDDKYTLTQLGLSGASDDFFGRDIEFYVKDGALLGGCVNVLGSTSIGAKLETVKKSDGSDDLTKISIDGVVHNISSVWHEFTTSGKAVKVNRKYNPAEIYDTAYGEFPVNSKGQFLPRASVPEILLMIYGDQRQYFSMAIDSDGDGRVDMLFVESIMPYLVTKVASSSASSKSTFKQLLGTWSRTSNGTIVKKAATTTQIARSQIKGTYKKNAVIEAAKVGKIFYITSTIEPKNTYLTMSSDRAVRFNGDAKNYTVQKYSNSIYYQAGPANITLGSIGQSTKGKYYVSGGRIIYVEIPKKEEIVKEVNFGVIISAAGETEWKYNEETDRFYREYPLLIDVGGRRIEVKVNSIDNVTVLNNDIGNAYGRYVSRYDVNGNLTTANEFVGYIVNDDGLYDIYTSATMPKSMPTPQKTMATEKGLYITYVPSTKTYKLGTYKFTLDNKSMIYYINEKGEIAYYTKSTMPSDFLDTKTASSAYFTNSTSSVKTLRAVMLAQDFELEQIPLVEDHSKHLLFLGDGEDLCYDNGQICYLYRYISIKDGTLHESASPLPAEGYEGYRGSLAIPMYNGMIGAFNKDGKTLTAISAKSYPLIYSDEVYQYHTRTKSLFTRRNSGGINASAAVFLDLEIDNVGTDEEEKNEIVAVHKATFDDFIVNLEDAIEHGDTMTVYIGYNSETKKAVYVLYSAGNNDLLTSVIK